MKINESNLQTAYHFTGIASFMNILKTGQLSLSLAYGDKHEERFNKNKYPFYLSTTQYTNPKLGYQSKMSGTLVRMELNILYMTSKGKFDRVMYFPKKSQSKLTGNPNFNYQSEDRFLSKESSLPFNKAVKKVDFFIRTQELPKSVFDILNRNGIPYEIHYDKKPSMEVVEYDSPYIANIAIVLKNAIENKWGVEASEEALQRGIKFLPNLKNFGQVTPIRVSMHEFTKPVIKEMLKPYIIMYMKDGKTANELEYDLNDAVDWKSLEEID